MDRPFNVLFLCTGNSARSIMSEVMMNAMGAPRFRAFSAGSHPAGKVNPFAIELLQKNRLPTEGLRSKSWDEFAQPGAPELDFVFTVCDSAAGEACPVWPGQPISAHWGIADPAAEQGDDEHRRRAFMRARWSDFLGISFSICSKGISLFRSLILSTISKKRFFACSISLSIISKAFVCFSNFPSQTE